MSGGAGKDEFPWQHSFPPFYTMQPHQETFRKQMEAWRSMVLDYCRRRGLTLVDVGELSASPLFNNTAIKRRLNDDFVVAILEDLKVRGNLEWVDPKTKKRAHVYWRSPEEWGALIYEYVRANGLTNTVCTFYELTEGSDTVGQKFHGLDTELLVKSLKVLELQKKAELFPNDEGVKFF